MGRWRWKQEGSLPRSPALRSLLVVLALLICLRSLPYFMPIRAAQIEQDQLAVEFSDRTGARLGTLLSLNQEHTAAVPLEQIAPGFLQAIIATEDQRFYQHGVLDGRAVVRSLLEAIEARQVVSGASTITLQLARMLREPAERSWRQKAQEVWLAWRLAAGMDKREILHAYVNRLPMGSNIYGVEAAARVYFGIPAADLNLAQASLLAALPNDPVGLDPYLHLEALKQRQTYVLNRMVAEGYLTAAQARRIETEAVGLRSRQQGIEAAPHFLFWLAQQLPATHPARLRTTLYLPLQQFVQAQVEQIVDELETHHVNHGAALVIENKTGAIRAYVGSPNYLASQAGRNDGVQALRQPGSTLKPFLYQLALEQGVIKTNSILADVPTHYAIPGAQVYSPVDYSERFHGPVRVRAALANSLNVPAVRVLEQVGVATFLQRLHQLGFAHLDQSPQHYGLGLALGSGEVSLWELGRAYWKLARAGQGGDLVALAPGQIEENQAKPLPNQRSQRTNKRTNRRTHAQANKPVLLSATQTAQIEQTKPDASTWEVVRDMLADDYARALSFGVDSVLNLPFPAAVKTGTSSDFRDTWTVGFTRDWTVATWVGNFSGEPMQQISGVTGAAPLWQQILLHLHQKQEPAAFPPPQGWVKKPICAISGFKPSPDCPSVVQEYLRPEELAAYEQTASQAFELPPVYDEWLAAQAAAGSAAWAPGDLRILVPREDAYFVVADDPGQWGQLALKVAVPSGQPVTWRINGQPWPEETGSEVKRGRERVRFWPMQLGEWTLEVSSGQLRDRVTFQVRLASETDGPGPDESSARGGFSVVAPASR